MCDSCPLHYSAVPSVIENKTFEQSAADPKGSFTLLTPFSWDLLTSFPVIHSVHQIIIRRSFREVLNHRFLWSWRSSFPSSSSWWRSNCRSQLSGPYGNSSLWSLQQLSDSGENRRSCFVLHYTCSSSFHSSCRMCIWRWSKSESSKWFEAETRNQDGTERNCRRGNERQEGEKWVKTGVTRMNGKKATHDDHREAQSA